MRQRKLGFFHLAQDMSRAHREYFAELHPLPDAKQALLATEASESLQRQEELEAGEDQDFESYLEGRGIDWRWRRRPKVEQEGEVQ